ncbi:hypothetical protein [Streptomyces sp. NBC_00280]
MRWHLNRSGEPARVLSRAAVDDFTVDTGTDSFTEVAVSVLKPAGRQ